MERLALMTPSPQAVAVEQSLSQLRARIAHYRFGAPPARSGGQLAIAR
jgi:hypothetical protein